MKSWCLLPAILLIAAVQSSAHHGLGTIDAHREIVITGTISGVEFVNPHSWLDLEGTSESDSSVFSYHCEMRPATGLLRSGWTPEMFVVGEAITVEASPDRVDPTRCYVATLIFSDGTRLDRYEERSAPDDPLASVGDRPLRLPNGDPNISGNWAAELYVLTDPRGQGGAFVRQSVAATVGPGGVPVGYRPMLGVRGFIPQTILAVLRAAVGAGSYFSRPSSEGGQVGDIHQTPLGQQARADFNRTVSQTDRFCGNVSIIRDWSMPEWSPVNRITQSGDTITLEYGHLGTVRTIHMDATHDPADIGPTRTGHSIGHWENDTLVVDSIGFSPGLFFRNNLHGEKLHLVERFTLDSEGSTLIREWQADDTDYLIGTATGRDEVYLTQAPYDVLPCQEE